jgi:hypothetical protein
MEDLNRFMDEKKPCQIRCFRLVNGYRVNQENLPLSNFATLKEAYDEAMHRLTIGWNGVQIFDNANAKYYMLMPKTGWQETCFYSGNPFPSSLLKD